MTKGSYILITKQHGTTFVLKGANYTKLTQAVTIAKNITIPGRSVIVARIVEVCDGSPAV